MALLCDISRPKIDLIIIIIRFLYTFIFRYLCLSLNDMNPAPKLKEKSVCLALNIRHSRECKGSLDDLIFSSIFDECIERLNVLMLTCYFKHVWCLRVRNCYDHILKCFNIQLAVFISMLLSVFFTCAIILSNSNSSGLSRIKSVHHLCTPTLLLSFFCASYT